MIDILKNISAIWGMIIVISFFAPLINVSYISYLFDIQEVCSQIWATLYDYPCLKTCDGIIKYVKECVRVAWGLVNQVRYQISYLKSRLMPICYDN